MSVLNFIRGTLFKQCDLINQQYINLSNDSTAMYGLDDSVCILYVWYVQRKKSLDIVSSPSHKHTVASHAVVTSFWLVMKCMVLLEHELFNMDTVKYDVTPSFTADHSVEACNSPQGQTMFNREG